MINREIYDILVGLGVTPQLKGFTYLCDAIDIYYPGCNVMEEIYKVVADQHKVTRKSVEKGIWYAKQRTKFNGKTTAELLAYIQMELGVYTDKKL